MPKIIVTFALPSEFAAWRRIARFERLKKGSGVTYLMRSRDAEVYAVMLGIGLRAVPSELHELLAGSADFCIASGLAGSLKEQYRAGTVVVANQVRASGPERAIQSDKSLVEAARKLGAASVDSFLTSSHVVNSRAEKLQLRDIADAVEMESFHVLSQAAKYGIPAVAVRAISDGAETSLPFDLNRIIDARGQLQWHRALYEIVKAPLRFAQLIRFALESARARRNLARFLDQYSKFLIADRRPALLAGAEVK